jgi:serine/threonine protein kinase
MIGEIISDKYKIEATVSESHMYEVFEAIEIETGATVVLKILKEEMAVNSQRVKNFSEEIRAFAGISHPLIAEILDIDMFEDRPYVVVEMVSGIDLHSLIRSKVLSFSESVKILQELATVLQHAADQKVGQRTIKLSNVLLDEKAKLKVLSFTHPRLKLAGKYRSSGNSETSGIHSDLFFLGTTFFEMLSGESPIRKRGGINELWDMKLEARLRIRHPALTPEQIDRVVEFVRKTLTRDMKIRFSTHEEFLKNLADLSGSIRGSSIRKKTRQLSMASQVVDALNGRMSNVNMSLPSRLSETNKTAAIATVENDSENDVLEAGRNEMVSGNLAIKLESKPEFPGMAAQNSHPEISAQGTRKNSKKIIAFPGSEKTSSKASAREVWSEVEDNESHWLKNPLILMGSSLLMMILLILFW